MIDHPRHQFGFFCISPKKCSRVKIDLLFVNLLTKDRYVRQSRDVRTPKVMRERQYERYFAPRRCDWARKWASAQPEGFKPPNQKLQ